MIKDNQTFFNRLHVVLDFLVTALAYFLAWYGRMVIFTPVDQGVLPWKTYFFALYFILPGYLAIFATLNLYKPKRMSSIIGEFFDVIKANVIGAMIFLVVLYLINQPNFSRSLIILFAVLNVVLMTAYRVAVRKILSVIRKKGRNTKQVVIVGYSRACEQYIDRILVNPQWGYLIRGILDDEVPAGTYYKGIQVLGRIDNLEEILPQNKLDEIAIALPLKNYKRLEEIVGKCEKSGVHTKFIPDYNSVIPSRPYTEDLSGLPVINIRRVPLTSTFNWYLKRAVDIIGSLVAIILFSPIMLLSVIVIKSRKDGPVLFVQERVGLHNKVFKMYKFRTMIEQKPEEEEKEWTTKNDPRVTGFGKFLRRTSLDETPQFFNILKGDMSLIGPRPERPQFVEQFKEEIPRYMVKHQVRPGLTGWAQVNGYRGDTSIRKRVEYDIYYIENWTIGLDVQIILLTFLKGFVNKNAY
ncbi:Undecaprenyl-phosphate glucose phosphotransferase [Lachnospiraceae bacterium G41]|nr:Undecaprenyl-phosphate glucose phosphotransferase [Lachnospiraceae bacterium G41]